LSDKAWFVKDAGNEKDKPTERRKIGLMLTRESWAVLDEKWNFPAEPGEEDACSEAITAFDANDCSFLGSFTSIRLTPARNVIGVVFEYFGESIRKAADEKTKNHCSHPQCGAFKKRLQFSSCPAARNDRRLLWGVVR
jgi:hypothetical protein